MELKSPCVKDCPNRRGGCTKNCEPFKEYEKQKFEAYNDAGKNPSLTIAAKLNRNRFYKKHKFKQRHGGNR